jgi:peptidyl-prolyl cis-trans isomerase D
MLRYLRKYSASKGVKVLYGTLAAVFILWGVGTVGGQKVDMVARVHGQPITRRDLERQTAAVQRRYEEVFKDRLTAEMAAGLDLRGRALDQLIDEALLREEAERLGVTVTDDEVIEAITRMPELQDGGRFDRDRLEAILRYQRDQGEFEAEIRRTILFQRLRALVTDGVQVSTAEVEERYRLDNGKVDLLFVRTAAADLAPGVTLSDEDLERYRSEHADTYRVPERLRVRYVAYRVPDFLDTVSVQDGEVAEHYELHKAERFTEPEQVRARHILVQTAAGGGEEAKAAARAEAEKLLAQVRAGGDFAALAREHSDDPGSAAKGGDLGRFARGVMTPEFETAAFALGVGEVSEIVETPFGFHVIKVEEHTPGGPRPLEAVRDEILTALRRERALELARQAAEADRTEVAHGKTLAEAAGERPITETPPFAEVDPVPGLGRVPAFSAAAFAFGDGEVSDLIETDDAIYLLAPFERAASYVPGLDEVRVRVENEARRARSEELARERAEALRRRAQEIGLEQAAAEAGATVEKTGPFGRREGAVPAIGHAPDLLADAFTLTTDAPLAPKVYRAAGDAIVASLGARTAADMAGFAAAKDTLLDSMLQQKRAAALTAYMSFLKERAQREGALEVRADALPRG